MPATLDPLSGPRATKLYRFDASLGAVQLTFRAGSQNVMIDNGRLVLTADAEGRPLTLWRDHALWRRGYDGRCELVSRDDGGERQRSELMPAAFLGLWRETVGTLVGCLERIADIEDRRRVAAMLSFDEERLAEDAQRYRALYDGLGILPPDAYLAVVVQLVEGCPYNRCEFCTFYRGRRYRVRPPDELVEHARHVERYLGRALPMRTSVFLADADALAAPDRALLEALARCREIFGERPVDAFASSFTRKGRDVDDYRALRDAGLRRVTLGMESGSRAVLERLAKPTSPEEIAASVAKMKSAGLQLNLMVLVGAGGTELASTHLDETMRLLAELPLDRGDRVYLSELALDASAPLQQRDPLGQPGPAELAAQTLAFRSALRRLNARPQVARYDIREFRG